MIGPKMIGKVYAIPPQPPVEENTHWLEAGALTIGVEYRDVNPDNLGETYGGTEYEAELLEKSPEGGFADEGVSIHVSETATGHEYVRFDCFDAEPHYHYIHNTPPGAEPVNNVIDFDVVAHGDMLQWAIRSLRERLPDMLANAGGGHLLDKIDHAVLDPVIEKVATMAEQAQSKFREARLP
jgi:hypothetical protein